MNGTTQQDWTALTRSGDLLFASVVAATFAVVPLAAQAPAGNFVPVALEDASSVVASFTHSAEDGESLSGVAWFDYNNDDWIDVYIANGKGHPDGLMRNNGDGTFTNVSEEAGIADLQGSSGVVAADLDNDGDNDIFVTGDNGAIYLASSSPARLFRNDGDGTFTDISAEAGIDIPVEPGSGWHSALGDIDNDGFLDLFVTAPGSLVARNQPANRLYRNNGDLTFTNISAGSGVDIAFGSCEAAFSHYDGDGLIDLYIADCNEIDFTATPIHLMKNNGDLTFTDMTKEVGLDTHNQLDPSPIGRGGWMCIAVGDYDNDSDQDLFATNLGLLVPFQEVGFFEQGTDGRFSSVETEVGIGEKVAEFGWGCTFADFNNDGFEDLTLAGSNPPMGQVGEVFGNPGYLFVGRSTKSFRNEGLPVDLSDRFSSGVAVADYDRNGFVDVLYSIGSWEGDLQAKPVLLKNPGNGNHWLTVKLVGTTSNRSAIGARVHVDLPGRVLTKEVRAGSSFLSQDSPWLTFGLNRTEVADRLIVFWPSGLREAFGPIDADQMITLVEGDGDPR